VKAKGLAEEEDDVVGVPGVLGEGFVRVLGEVEGRGIWRGWGSCVTLRASDVWIWVVAACNAT
jgi:hypothetical protein